MLNGLRLRNKLRQVFYRPEDVVLVKLSERAKEMLDSIDNEIEERITPLLEDFFKE